jgi:CheY-like chemotaxis protein
MPSVLIVDDHDVVRRGVRHILETQLIAILRWERAQSTVERLTIACLAPHFVSCDSQLRIMSTGGALFCSPFTLITKCCPSGDAS